MSHMHFGRVVPITFRRFPSLICRNLLGKVVRVPQDLQGQLSVLVVGFKAAHYDDMNSWMPFASRLGREIMDKHKLDVSQVQSYRLVVRNRAGVLLRWWTDERLRFAIGTGYSEPSVPGADEMAHIFKRTRLRAGTETIDARGAIDAAVQAPERAKGESAEVSSKDQKHEEIRLARLQATRSRTLVCFTDKSAFVDELQLADAQRVYIFLLDRKGEIAWCEHEQYSASKEVEIRELLQLPKTESSVLLTRSDTSRCRIMLPSANGTAEDRQD